jgi:exopolysaccharide biosynthesis polyprenyl glycosylphosphotransferase
LAREPAVTTGPPVSEEAQAEPVGDIRSARPGVVLRSLVALVRRTASIAALALLDICGLALGLYSALFVREIFYGNYPPLWGFLWREAVSEWLPFIALVMLLVFWQAGLYRPREVRGGIGRIVSSLVLVAIVVFVFGLGIDHPFNTFGLFPVALVTTAISIGLFRAGYEGLTRDLLRLAGVRRRAVLVGEGESLERLHRTLGSSRSGIEYEFVGAITRSGDGVALPVLGRLDELSMVLDAREVDELIMSDAEVSERRLLEIVEQAHRHGVKVRVAPTTAELLVQRGEYLPGQGVPLFELRPPVFAGIDWAVKRTFDVVMSVLVIALGLPFWLAIAAAIRLSSHGPVLYRDRRIGVNEKPFDMLKFRTMQAGASERQAELEAANEADGPLFKIRADPRVTRVGALLRRFSLDEIPQVLNVLRGEMSLVGPRPLPLRDYANLDAWHRKRYLVLPGMTGLWQISGRANLSFDDLVRLDFYYLENWSVWLDISILAKTLPAVVRQSGAY